MKKSKLLADVVAARRASGLNQSEFWSRFGVTQSGGSRYESGRNIPKPLKTLMWLYVRISADGEQSFRLNVNTDFG